MNPAQKYSLLSKLFDLLEYPLENLFFKKWRKECVSLAKNLTLEVGVGTGKNLSFYSKEVLLVAIDFSSGMLEIAKKKAKDSSTKGIKILNMDVETMTFETNTFDSAVSTFVFCTVPDPLKGLKELHRVLKPKGKAFFLEHMRSKNTLINLFLKMMNVFSRRISGTEMLRETQKNIEAAGFSIEKVENKFFDIIKLISAIKQ